MKLPKILISTACIVVIAASGWSLADRWQVHKAQAEQAEFEAWRDECFATFDKIIAGKALTAKARSEGPATNEGILINCLWRGGQPMKDELNRRLIASGRNPIS